MKRKDLQAGERYVHVMTVGDPEVYEVVSNVSGAALRKHHPDLDDSTFPSNSPFVLAEDMRSRYMGRGKGSMAYNANTKVAVYRIKTGATRTTRHAAVVEPRYLDMTLADWERESESRTTVLAQRTERVGQIMAEVVGMCGVTPDMVNLDTEQIVFTFPTLREAGWNV